ncbi:hypothetical protein ZWY2020_015611 [Hordeum vulgare]|nr:hypothetical protein ZWY2020_015611 [Hordeum vulgare]
MARHCKVCGKRRERQYQLVWAMHHADYSELNDVSSSAATASSSPSLLPGGRRKISHNLGHVVRTGGVPLPQEGAAVAADPAAGSVREEGEGEVRGEGHGGEEEGQPVI